MVAEAMRIDLQIRLGADIVLLVKKLDRLFRRDGCSCGESLQPDNLIRLPNLQFHVNRCIPFIGKEKRTPLSGG